VVSVGIGEKMIGGVPTGQLAVKVLVREKKPEYEVSSDAAVPRSLGGVITDVEETGEIRASMFTARRRPAPCGGGHARMPRHTQRPAIHPVE
jgi:hypothetical protein